MLGSPASTTTVQASAAAWGLHVVGEVVEDAPCEVWAEHWPAVRIFGGMLSQWRWAEGCRVGLDYMALPLVEQRLGIKPRVARKAFAHLQVLESEALQWYSEQR